MDFKVGDRIRRKNHRKQKNKPNSHEILTIVSMGKQYGEIWLTFKDSNGKISCMSERGLPWYERI